MTRITIEIDGKETSSTTVQPTGNLGAPAPELLGRATALGALDAGSARSGIASFDPAVVTPAAIDAGPYREEGASSEQTRAPKSENRKK
jgi:hypothetical protein